MNYAEQITKMRKEIAELEKLIARCPHSYSKPFYDPETYLESYGTGRREENMGVDAQEIYEYRPAQRDRWSKKCVICGHTVSTNTQKPVVTDYEPDFGSR